MAAARVVVVEHDEWVLRLLLDGLREGGLVVATAPTVEEGLHKVRDLNPDCVLCEVDLPGDGYALVRSMRADKPPVSLIPVAMLASDEDDKARTLAFEAGADALIERPFRLEEVIAQINALVQLARRMKERRNSLIDSLSAGPPSSPESASFRGDLQHMPIASLLTLLELERKSGSVSVKSGERAAKLNLADGHIVTGTLDGKAADPVMVLRAALDWKEGRITFRATGPVARPLNARPVRILLAEAKPGSVPITRASNPRMQAIPPPPGQRKPALDDQPTARVDVPTISNARPPSEPPSTEKPK
jgi:two-component system, OmpR family, response regulator